MLSEIVDFVKDLVERIKPQPLTVVVDGETYGVEPSEYGLQIDKHIQLPAPPAKPTLKLSTLTGFADAFKVKIDDFPEKVAVHVIDPVTVALVSMDADKFGRRHEWLRAVCGETNPFPFYEYQLPELFLIRMQSGFLPTDNVINLQRLASSLTTENSIGVQDDGLSQVITVKQGTVTRDAVQLPSRISLYAYRTFREIDPIGSDFMVRLKGDPGKLPSIALLEVDAGRWKLDTMHLVSRWLRDALPDGTPVIS